MLLLSCEQDRFECTEIIIYRRFSNFQTTTIEFTWPFTRSPSGVGGYRRDCRVSGLDGLDDSKSILSRLGSSRGPRTVNDPYTPSPCCETNHPPWLYSFFRQQLLNRITLRDSTRLAIRTTASFVSRGCARERRLFRGISRITESLVASDPIDRIWFPYRTIRSVTRIAYIPGRIQTCHVSRTIPSIRLTRNTLTGNFTFGNLTLIRRIGAEVRWNALFRVHERYWSCFSWCERRTERRSTA